MTDETEERPTETAPHRPPSRAVLIAERRATVLERRKAGYTSREIGEELGVDHKTVLRDEAAAIKALVRPGAEDVRKLLLERLERLWKVSYAIATDENATPEQRIKGVDSCVRIAARVATMEGIDEPQKFDIGPWLERLATQQGLDPNRALEMAASVVKDLGF